MSYSPETKLAYIPVVDLGGTFADNVGRTPWEPENGRITTGVDTTGDTDDPRPEEATAALIAWDPVRQEQVWRVQAPYMVPAGTMATAGGLVFQGGVDGKLNAFSATDGKKLWSHDMQAPGVIAPITWSADGKQYVTILTGTSGVPAAWGKPVADLGLDYRTLKRRVLTFALGGDASLPAREIVKLEKPFDPDYRPDAAKEQLGDRLYHSMTCGVCHGYDAVAGGRAPDLRYSPVPLDADAFAAIVRNGALVSAGMPNFRGLTDEQLEAIRQYVRAQARDTSLDEKTKKTGMKLAI